MVSLAGAGAWSFATSMRRRCTHADQDASKKRTYRLSASEFALNSVSRSASETLSGGYPLDVSSLPRLVAVLDPDSTSTALAHAVRQDDGSYRFIGVEGGGSRAVTWQTITGARSWLSLACVQFGCASNEVTVVVETQAPDGPQSAACEELRRVRYHWQAACEVDGYDCTFVDANDWEREFLRGEVVGRGAGARKVAYRRKAKALTPQATNEDRCAAIGMLWWYVTCVLGSTLVFDHV